MISIPKEVIEEATAKYGASLFPLKLKPGAFGARHQPEEMYQGGGVNMWACYPELDEEIAYEVAKILADYEDAWGTYHASWKGVKAKYLLRMAWN